MRYIGYYSKNVLDIPCFFPILPLRHFSDNICLEKNASVFCGFIHKKMLLLLLSTNYVLCQCKCWNDHPTFHLCLNVTFVYIILYVTCRSLHHWVVGLTQKSFQYQEILVWDLLCHMSLSCVPQVSGARVVPQHYTLQLTKGWNLSGL